jgi:hypothetical protein
VLSMWPDERLRAAGHAYNRAQYRPRLSPS